MRHRSFLLSALLVGVLTSGCDPSTGADAGGPDDGGTLVRDAGVGAPDGGTSPRDAGGERDGGTEHLVIVATPGVPCAEDNKVGRVFVGKAYESWVVGGTVHDALPQFSGLPHTVAGSCGNYAPTACPSACAGNDVCLYNGTCGAQPLARTDVSFTLHDLDSVIAQGSANAVTGEFSAALEPVEVTGAPLTLDVRLDAETGGGVTLQFAATLPPAFASGEPSFIDQAPDPLDSGDIVMSWTASGESDVFMRTQMLPNHHAGVAITECLVDDGLGEVTVDATLADALRLVTGLEGNGYGLRHRVASATLPSGGCVEAVFGHQTQWSFF